MTKKPGNLKASYHTLGCKLNFAETASIQKILEEKGIHTASEGESPDICVVNTCSVTSVADKKAKHLIRNLSRRFPETSILVTGCYAQLKPEEVASLPGVAMVLGSSEKLRMANYIDEWLDSRKNLVKVTPVKEIKEFHATCERGDRTRYFLKVQDGCSYYCTYCTIPYARGHSRSGNINDIIALAEDASSKGAKEIVITGVNVGEFGKDHGEEFFDLLKRLDEIQGVERFRISSIEPNLLTEEIIRWIAEDSQKFMPHFHIPLQSGSDKVLSLMKRRYDTSLFASRIKFIRELLPLSYIGVDIIAGARGETEEEWEKSLEFASGIDVSKFHVFPYSERPGTRALMLAEIVSQEEKHRRVEQLTRLSQSKTDDFIERNFGEMRKVLWESAIKGGKMQGFTDNYLRVEAPYDSNLINKVTQVVVNNDNIVRT